MSTHLVTGKAGYEHVKASDHAALHAAIMGTGEFVLEGGKQFACQVISNNKVRIFDGEAMMQGRHIRIDPNTYEETTHENGVQGYKRIDLIVLTYEKNESTGIEAVTLEVIKGTPAESNPEVPEYVTGDILTLGELKNQMPLYRIPFDGLSIGEPVKLFGTVPTLEVMKKEVDAEVDAKKAELDKKFTTLEEEMSEKIAEAGKPLVSDIDEAGMIENYGEYSADAKMVADVYSEVTDSLMQSVSSDNIYSEAIASSSANLSLAVGTYSVLGKKNTDCPFGTIENNILTITKKGLYNFSSHLIAKGSSAENKGQLYQQLYVNNNLIGVSMAYPLLTTTPDASSLNAVFFANEGDIVELKIIVYVNTATITSNTIKLTKI